MTVSNEEWHNPHDPDAKITKMKDGRTHLAYKPEHAVDLQSGAIVAAEIHLANAKPSLPHGGPNDHSRQTYIDVS